MTRTATGAAIHEEARPAGVIPNVVDYAAARPGFPWDADYPLITTIDGFVAYVVAARPKEARHVT